MKNFLKRALWGMAGTAFLCTSLLAQGNLNISGYGNAHVMGVSGMPETVEQNSLRNTTMQIREFTLYFDFTITDRIIASVELESGRNAKIYESNYAYIEAEATDNLKLRIGKLLVPFLYYNENKPNFKQYLMSQPFTAWNFAPVIGAPVETHGYGWSDVGVMLEWYGEMGESGLFSIKTAVINGISSENNALDAGTIQLADGAMQPVVRNRTGLLHNEEDQAAIDNNNSKAVVFKAVYKSIENPLEVGASFYRGAWNNRGDKYLTMYGVHLNWLGRNFGLRSEYGLASVQQDAGYDPVAEEGLTGPAALNTTTGDYGMKAFFVELSFIPKRWQGERFLRLIGRFDDVDTNDQAAFTPFDRSRFTAGLEWQFAKGVRARFESQYSKIDSFDQAPAPYRNAGGKEVITLSMASIIFSF